MNNFKLSGFGDESGNTIEEQIRVLQKNNINNIEIRNVNGKVIISYSDDELKLIKKQLDAGGIKVSAIGSPIGKTAIIEDFSLTLESFERAVMAAEILEAPYIRAFSFYIPNGEDPMKWADDVVSRLTELVKIAGLRGKKYALENESGIFTDIPERCAYVLNKIPEMCFVFDPSNFIMNNADTLEAWNMLKKRVTYFHIKDGTREPRRPVPAGEGEGKIPEILKAAFSGGYDNYLSIEPHLKYMSHLNNAQQFTTAANALKKILNNAFNVGLELAEV